MSSRLRWAECSGRENPSLVKATIDARLVNYAQPLTARNPSTPAPYKMGLRPNFSGLKGSLLGPSFRFRSRSCSSPLRAPLHELLHDLLQELVEETARQGRGLLRSAFRPVSCEDGATRDRRCGAGAAPVQRETGGENEASA